MKNNSEIFTKSFVWALAYELEKQGGFVIDKSIFANIAKKSFFKIPFEKAAYLIKAASKAVLHILEKEKLKIATQKFKIKIVFSTPEKDDDFSGVILYNEKIEIGLSCQLNSADVKFLRLSNSIDFVADWGLSEKGCSKSYWTKINTAFEKLQKIKTNHDKDNIFTNLKYESNICHRFILDAFIDEIVFLKSTLCEPKLCSNLLSNLIGKKDFYKITVLQHEVTVQAFNYNGALSIPKYKPPKSIVGIDRKDNESNYQTIIFSHGYSFRFGLHDDDVKNTASLRLSVNILSLPPKKIYTNHITI
jgi:HaeIII restriction endonuclease